MATRTLSVCRIPAPSVRSMLMPTLSSPRRASPGAYPPLGPCTPHGIHSPAMRTQVLATSNRVLGVPPPNRGGTLDIYLSEALSHDPHPQAADDPARARRRRHARVARRLL